MLRKCLKISDTTKNKFIELLFLKSHHKVWQKNCRVDLSSILDVSTCSLSISVLTQGFLGIYQLRFLQSIISERNYLWAWSLCLEYSKFYLDSVNAEKTSENIFSFGDNCIWIGSVKHSPLLRENTFHRV